MRWWKCCDGQKSWRLRISRPLTSYPGILSVSLRIGSPVSFHTIPLGGRYLGTVTGWGDLDAHVSVVCTDTGFVESSVVPQRLRRSIHDVSLTIALIKNWTTHPGSLFYTLSHTLGGTSCILFTCIDLTEVGKSVPEMELWKPRNLFSCVNEERCGREKWSRVSFFVKAKKKRVVSLLLSW